jgi:hypothetical protein
MIRRGTERKVEQGKPAMAMGRRNVEQQGQLWVPTGQLPRSPGHVFYQKLNGGVLAEAGFDPWVERLCRPFYADKLGRPIPPGVYFSACCWSDTLKASLAARHRVAVRRFAVAAEISRPGVE